MYNKFKKVYSLVVLCVLAGMVWVTLSPRNEQLAFNHDAAAVDAATFQSYVKGVVRTIEAERTDAFTQQTSLYQLLTITLLSGNEQGSEVSIEQTTVSDAGGSNRFIPGDKVVIGVLDRDSGKEYVIVDRYRLPAVVIIIGSFMVLAILLGRWRGLTALVGLGATGLVMLCFIAPQIAQGKDPFIVSLVGAAIIALVTMFIAHGFKIRTQLAMASTLLTLVLAALAAWIAVRMGSLFGFGQADAFVVETGYFGAISLRGLLLGGIIISVLGVLDDITTSQAAAVEELHRANKAFTVRELYDRGISIGREHIASLINTLILVYAGTSLPLFLLITVTTEQPIWVLINSEYLSEEIVRAVIGSAALLIAVPVTTILAAWYYGRMSDSAQRIK